jgi:hypothetical protein
LGKSALDRVESINARLKAAHVPIRVRVHGGSLYLRSSRLPPKPGDAAGKRYEIPMGPASDSDIALIELKAHQLWQLVVQDRFDWTQFSKVKNAETVGEWVDKLEQHRLSTGKCSQDTFSKFWRKAVFDRMDSNKPLTQSILLAAVLETKENTWSRRRACQALTVLAKFAGIEIDLSSYSGGYGINSVVRRELPTDDEIVNWYENITNPAWQRIFARIAVFGLRPSESFHFEVIDDHTARVIDAKTKRPRETKAFHPSWGKSWNLKGDEPNVTWRNASELSNRIRVQLKRHGVTCERYDLRHAWCVRSSVYPYRIPVSVAARWAGHSPDVHQNIYNRWIRSDQEKDIYETLALGN